MNLPKFDWKRPLKFAFIYGVPLEIFAIGTGYYLYRQYTTNPEFRNHCEDKFPQLIECFGKISGFYLTAVPKEWRDKILDVNKEQSGKTDVPPSQK